MSFLTDTIIILFSQVNNSAWRFTRSRLDISISIGSFLYVVSVFHRRANILREAAIQRLRSAAFVGAIYILGYVMLVVDYVRADYFRNNRRYRDEVRFSAHANAINRAVLATFFDQFQVFLLECVPVFDAVFADRCNTLLYRLFGG